MPQYRHFPAHLTITSVHHDPHRVGDVSGWGGFVEEDHRVRSGNHAQRGSRSTGGDHAQPGQPAAPIPVGCGSSGGSEVLRFRSSGAAGVLVHDGAGVTAHRWLKVAFVLSTRTKATFSRNRTASEATTVTPTTNAPPELRCPSTRATQT